MIKVTEIDSRKIVSPFEMKLGQVGRIVKWNGKRDVVAGYVGTIVVRGYNSLYSADFVAMARNENWSTVEFLNNVESEAVEILPAGTKIEITL